MPKRISNAGDKSTGGRFKKTISGTTAPPPVAQTLPERREAPHGDEPAAQDVTVPGPIAAPTPKGTILAGAVGSTAYGLATANSDVDTLGVFVADTREILGLQGAQKTEETITSTNPDGAFHEIGKYLRLALKGNPTILELLYLPAHTTRSELGDNLVSIRDHLLSSTAVENAYGGYAMSQAKRLLSRFDEGKRGFGSVPVNRIEKHGRHCLRLLLQGQELLETGSLTIDASQHREFLFSGGEIAARDPEAFRTLAEDQLALLSAAAQSTRLPKHPNIEKVNQFLVEARLAALSQSKL